jgi:hypothetical protein
MARASDNWSDMTRITQTPGQRWLLAHTLAMAFSLAHLSLDWGAQLIGGPVGTAITPLQARVLVGGSALYAGWAGALVLAGQGGRRAMLATARLCAIAALGNGACSR